MAYEVRPLTDAEGDMWDSFVTAHPLGRGSATTASQKRWLEHGWTLRQIGAFDQGNLVAGAAIYYKNIPYLSLKASRVLALMPDPRDVAGSTQSVLEGVEQFARSVRAAEVELRCFIPRDHVVKGVEYSQGVIAPLEQRGYFTDGFCRMTYLVRIDQDDESLLKSFTSKCRRDVRKGLRDGVEVVPMEGPADLRIFCDAHLKMCGRKNLPDFEGQANYETLLAMFGRGYVRVFGAMYDGCVRNMAYVDACGIPRYEIGASTDAMFEKGVPPTGQPLHFGIMKWFRDRGREYYDLGGSPGPEPQPGHPNYTVWRFKYEFGAPFVYMVPYYRKSLSTFGRLVMAVARKVGRVER